MPFTGNVSAPNLQMSHMLKSHEPTFTPTTQIPFSSVVKAIVQTSSAVTTVSNTTWAEAIVHNTLMEVTTVYDSASIIMTFPSVSSTFTIVSDTSTTVMTILVTSSAVTTVIKKSSTGTNPFITTILDSSWTSFSFRRTIALAIPSTAIAARSTAFASQVATFTKSLVVVPTTTSSGSASVSIARNMHNGQIITALGNVNGY